MKSYTAKEADMKTQAKWYMIDATDLVLGRLAAYVASGLRGKLKATYTPNVLTGDKYVIINAEKVALTGNKMEGKVYRWHTGFPGGVKERTVKQILTGAHADRVIKDAVKNMIRKGPLRNQMLENLYVYAGTEHPHSAQQPQMVDVASKNRKNKRSAA
ncbi:MAG: 50S ribosomal protein L13 [Alphaproteobacteria bacterium]|nr:MAG: 50S ribosomal protein L13 [Alphaproteobacteria bacterium]